MIIRVATRGSRLALAQTDLVADKLRAIVPEAEVTAVIVTTSGDRDQSATVAGTGWFTTALQDALQAGEADIAVHSYKDLPTRRPEGLVIAAVPFREDPRDALVTRDGRSTLRQLARGSVVGTGSPRREVQLRASRPDLDVRPIRGNVDTRIAKVDAFEYDAVVLALAGLRRLGLEARATEVFSVYDMLPAPAQGALAIECRAADRELRALLARIDNRPVREEVTAERSFLAALEAGCRFPAGAYAEHFGSTLKLHGFVATDAGAILRSKMAGAPETAAGLGRALAGELLARSAGATTTRSREAGPA
ncbi:MAG: hydroxymethylbilane synthase [Dehalococcoidia bacterium]